MNAKKLRQITKYGTMICEENYENLSDLSK